MKYRIILLTIVFMCLSNSADAAILHQYTCADSLGYVGASPTCVGTDVFTYGGGAASVQDNNTYFVVNDSDTVYISYIGSGLSGTNLFQFNGTVGVSNYSLSDGAFSEDPYPVSGMGSAMIAFYMYSSTASTIEGVCIDGDGYSCSGGTPPTPPAYTPVFDMGTTTCTVINASTTVCTNERGTQTVDNPVQDLAIGYILFFMTFFGVVWFFRRK